MDELKKWIHRRKGPIVGTVVKDEGGWLSIKLAVDHNLAYLSDSNRGRIDEQGQILTVHKDLLREVTWE